MRLYEILTEYEFPDIKVRSPRKKVPNIYDHGRSDRRSYPTAPGEEPKPESNDAKIKTLGSGTFSSAYVHKDSPQDVVKGSIPAKVPDGFEIFFRALSKDKEVQANPYFPRFRNINTFSNKHQGENRRTSYIVRVEKLEPLNVLSDEESQMLFHKMFTEEGRRQIKYKRPSRKARPWETIENGIDLSFWRASTKIKDEIKDPHLLAAVDFIQSVAGKTNYGIDLHEDNIMVRRTSVGPQIVLNDPLGFSRDR